MTRPDAPTSESESGVFSTSIQAIRTRVLSGLLLALPIAITIWIILQIYLTLQGLLLNPTARLIALLFGVEISERLPRWWVDFVAPLIGVGLAIVLLYLLGYLVRTKLADAIDWVMLRVPFVTTIYRSVRKIFQALEDPTMGFKRVVLVEFPHPGMRSLAFVTKSLRDQETKKEILCTCVLTGVMPPSGFTLFVDASDVIDVDWTVRDTLQAIVSGGITSPSIIRYYRGQRTIVETDRIIDSSGRPIEHGPFPADGE